MNSTTARAIRTAWTARQIPYGARVIAIADAYDTITSERTYKKARTPEEAFLELERCAANQFDPELVRSLHGNHAPRAAAEIEAGVTVPDGPSDSLSPSPPPTGRAKFSR